MGAWNRYIVEEVLTLFPDRPRKNAMVEYRFDAATIKKWEKTPEGFVKFFAPIAREGWLNYTREDGTKRREWVSRKTLQRSAKTFVEMPVSKLHPEGGRMITAKNATGLTTGWTSNLAAMDDDGVLWLKGSIFDADTIAGIESGDISEISCGYRVAVAPRGDLGDLEQIDREGNHVAAVPRGRAGPGVRFYFDADDGEESSTYWCTDSIEAEMPEDLFTNKRSKKPPAIDPDPGEADDPPDPAPEQVKSTPMGRTKPMKTILDGLEITVDGMDEAKHVQAVNSAFLKLRSDHAAELAKTASLTGEVATIAKRADSLDAEVAKLKTDLANSELALDALQIDHDELKEGRGDSADPARIDAEAVASACASRMALWSQVLPYLRSDSVNFEPDYALDELGIMTLAVKVANPALSNHIDGLDLATSEGSGFIKGLFAALNPEQQRKDARITVDSILGDIATGRTTVANSYTADSAGRMDKVRDAYRDASKRK